MIGRNPGCDRSLSPWSCEAVEKHGRHIHLLHKPEQLRGLVSPHRKDGTQKSETGIVGASVVACVPLSTQGRLCVLDSQDSCFSGSRIDFARDRRVDDVERQKVMTVTDPPPTSSGDSRLFEVILLIHVVVGYAFYFTAVGQAPPPGWALAYIEQLKPTFGALETAARLSEHPLPAQVMIVYTVITSILLSLYMIYATFFVERNRQEAYRRLQKLLQHPGPSIKKRLGFAACGVALLYIYGYYVPVDYFLEGRMREGVVIDSGRLLFRVTTLFSSSIMSATLLLVHSVLTAFAFVAAPLCFYLSVARFESTHQ